MNKTNCVEGSRIHGTLMDDLALARINLKKFIAFCSFKSLLWKNFRNFQQFFKIFQ